MDYPWSGPDLALALWMCYVWTYLPRCVVVSSLLLRCTPVQILFMGLANIQFLEADGFSWSPIEPSEHGFWQTFHVMDVKQESSCLSASHHGQRKTIRVPSGILHVHAVEGEEGVLVYVGLEKRSDPEVWLSRMVSQCGNVGLLAIMSCL